MTVGASVGVYRWMHLEQSLGTRFCALKILLLLLLLLLLILLLLLFLLLYKRAVSALTVGESHAFVVGKEEAVTELEPPHLLSHDGGKGFPQLAPEPVWGLGHSAHKQVNVVHVTETRVE